MGVGVLQIQGLGHGPCLGRWRWWEAFRVINLEMWVGGPTYSVLGTMRNHFSSVHLGHGLLINRASLVAQGLKNLPAVQDTLVWSLGWEEPLEEEMATHSSILAWRIPWTEEATVHSKESDTTEQLTFWLWLNLLINDILLWEGKPLWLWAGNLWGQPSYISEPKGKNKNTEEPLNLLHGRVPTALKSPSLERSMELNKLHP